MPAAGDLVAVAALPGETAVVRLANPATGAEVLRLTAYDGYNGPVNVAAGDVDGDGLVDLVTGTGAGTAAHVKVFRGRDGALLHSFLAFDPGYLGGVSVAAADVDYDGKADIVAGSQDGASHVKAFRGATGAEFRSFLAFDGFTGGVCVSAADVTGDGRCDLVVGAGPGAAPHVKVFDGAGGVLVQSYLAFADGFRGGVHVSAGDINADGFDDVVAGAGAGAGGHVKVFSGDGGAELASFLAFDPAYTGGVRPGVCAIDGSAGLDVMAVAVPGGPATRAFNGRTLAPLTDFVAGTPGAACTGASTADGDAVLDFNRAARAAIRAAVTPPPRASRALAMLHAAVYDAVNNILGERAFYAVAPADLPAPAGASPEAAAAGAGRRVLSALFPASRADFDDVAAGLLALVPNGPAEDAGLAYGTAVADRILSLRANDGSAAVVPYVSSGAPGEWVPTPPAFAPALLPNWPTVTPFTMTGGDQFRPAGPPALTSAEYAAEFNEVKALGRADSTTRTPDQTQIARFWASGAGTVTPPGQWNQIADEVSVRRGLGLAENARLFATLNLALADAAIVSWDAKYHFVGGAGLWRPVTAVARAAEDGNPDTAPDAGWLPLIATPPFPEYTSGHSTFSGAADRVLTHVFGPTAFSIHTDALPGVVRRFDSFAEAADEAGRSRIYGGIHFTSANRDGLSSGRALGAYVVQTQLGDGTP